MKTTPRKQLLKIALFCALTIAGLIPAKASAATVIVTTGRGRYYHNGAYYMYHPMFGGYYNYTYRGRYYMYYYKGGYYNHRVVVAPARGRRVVVYRYW